MGVRVVLVRPQNAGNVGAAARSLRNAGLEGLDLVAPGDWRTLECWRTAWGAHDVLEQARVFGSLAEAVAGSALAVALSGRGDRGAPASDVRDVAARIAGLAKADRASLVFGPEASGLSGEEIALCGLRARIPTHPARPSLNLSHAVAIAGYEVYRAGRRAGVGPRRATHEEKERLLALLREGLLRARALPTRDTDVRFQAWRGLVRRMDLTPREARLLEHLARKLGAAPGART